MAEDLLHDAFVIILTSLDKLEDPGKIESWMTAIVRNVGYHYRQHLNKEQSAGEARDGRNKPDPRLR